MIFVANSLRSVPECASRLKMGDDQCSRGLGASPEPRDVPLYLERALGYHWKTAKSPRALLRLVSKWWLSDSAYPASCPDHVLASRLSVHILKEVEDRLGCRRSCPRIWRAIIATRCALAPWLWPDHLASVRSNVPMHLLWCAASAASRLQSWRCMSILFTSTVATRSMTL